VTSVLAIALLARCSSDSPSEGSDISVSEMNRIHGGFVAALKRRHWAGPDGFEMCVLGSQTVTYGDDSGDEEPGRWERFHEQLPSLRRDAYDSYWKNNEEPRTVAPAGPIPMRVHVLNQTDIAELEKDDDAFWESFRDRFDNAVRVYLSTPGVSTDGQQALIYYEASFYWLAAWGGYALMTRQEGQWVIVKEWILWES